MLFKDFYGKRVKTSCKVGKEFVFGKNLGGVGCSRGVEKGEFLIRRDFKGGVVRGRRWYGVVHYY
jgi:hypothetical protein